MPLDDDSVAVHQIPTVNELCQELHLEDAVSQFRQTLISFRKTYTTASGITGMDITDWGSERNRRILGLMAQDFLETDGYAFKYWPSSGRAEPQAGLEYPKDRIK